MDQVQEEGSRPTIQFFRLIRGGRSPQRADRSAGGTLPTRAYRYCEASATASGWGWYVFPPMRFSVRWSGYQMEWNYGATDKWHPLGSSQFPGFRAWFDERVPDEIKRFSPPFLGALPEPGLLQVWSGLIARTKPNWSVAIRGPVNMARRGYDVLDGLIETDAWFGPLFVNLRLTRTDIPIEFDPDVPLFQVQPIPYEAYSNRNLNDVTISEFDELGRQEWEAYYGTVVKPQRERCRHGDYAVAVRRRRQQASNVDA